MYYLYKWICCHTVLALLLCYFVLQVLISRPQKIPTLLWWTPFIPIDNRHIQCGKHECLIVNNRSINVSTLEAIMFYGSRLRYHDFPLPRSNHILWSLYHEESPKNFPALLYSGTQELFNITATFSQNSDYPLTLQYLSDLNVLTERQYYVTVENKNRLSRNLAPLLYVQSNCESVTDRDELVKEMMKYIEVDSYGNCLNNRHFPERLQQINPLDTYNEDFLNYISNYKFIISFENAICEDYISEKLWRPLIVGSIPIYLGAPNIKNWLPNKNSAILVKDFKDIKSLVQYINMVNQNDTLYNTYMEHKLFKHISNNSLKKFIGFPKENRHPVLDFECFVCRKLYENITLDRHGTKNIFNCDKPRVGNFWAPHWSVAEVQSKALNIKMNENKPFNEGDFQRGWLSLYRG